jgi:phosphoglycerate dehydrogenase-like enzyme
MAVLVPGDDGLADLVASRFPAAKVLTYGAIDGPLDDVSFYCLPYMGASAAVELVRSMPRLHVIQSLSSGVDDVIGHVPDGVTLCNGRGLHHEESTAELAVGLVLAALRCLPQFVRQQSTGAWRHLRADSLDGKRVLILGHGAIGRAVEARLAPFGANMTRVSRTPRFGVQPLAALTGQAASADVLIVCLPLTDVTRGIVGAEVLAALHDGALLVNVSRGPVVDSAALRQEVSAGRLMAALDVTDPEPLPPDDGLWSLPNVLITPHVGGDTTAFVARAGEFLVAQVGRHLHGEPLMNVIAPSLEDGG